MGRKSGLTEEIIQEIAGKIKIGSFIHVAAEASGVPRATFYLWMKKGEQEESDGLYKQLVDEVCLAKADARHNAESRVFEDRPYEWLRTGPGRTEPDSLGWTEKATLEIEGNIHHEHEIEDYTRAPTDAETLGKALMHLDECLPGGLAALRSYIEKKTMKTIEGKVEDNGESNGPQST